MRGLLLVATIAGCGRLGFDGHVGAPGDAPDGAVVDGGSIPPAITLVQHTAGNMPQTPMQNVVAFPVPVTVGDVLIIAVDNDAPTTQVVTTTDLLGNTFEVAAPPVGSGTILESIQYAVVTQGGSDTITVTLSAPSQGFFEIRLHEFSGLSTTNPFMVSAFAVGSATDVDGSRSPPIATSSTNEMIFGFGTFDNQATPGTGFTLAGNDFGDITEFQIEAGAGSYEATATNFNGGNYVMMAAAFRGQ